MLRSRGRIRISSFSSTNSSNKLEWFSLGSLYSLVNVTLQLIRPIHKLSRKWLVVNTVPGCWVHSLVTKKIMCYKYDPWRLVKGYQSLLMYYVYGQCWCLLFLFVVEYTSFYVGQVQSHTYWQFFSMRRVSRSQHWVKPCVFCLY